MENLTGMFAKEICSLLDVFSTRIVMYLASSKVWSSRDLVGRFPKSDMSFTRVKRIFPLEGTTDVPTVMSCTVIPPAVTVNLGFSIPDTEGPSLSFLSYTTKDSTS